MKTWVLWVNYFLGIVVTRHKGGIFLSQRKYAHEIIEWAGMISCRPSSTLLIPSLNLVPTLVLLSRIPLFTSLLLVHYSIWLSRCLRYHMHFNKCVFICITLGIPHACPQMHCAYPMLASKKIHCVLCLWYSSSWLTFVFLLCRHWPCILHQCWLEVCLDTRRSTFGYYIFLGDNMSFWSSKRQANLSRSSAEFEYCGVATVVIDYCWIENLLLDLHSPLEKAMLVYCDDVSDVYLFGNHVQHQCTKHIEMNILFFAKKWHVVKFVFFMFPPLSDYWYLYQGASAQSLH